MRFICTQDNLLKGLSRITGVAGKNKQLPILDNVLIRVGDGVMQLVATDLEIGIRTSVAGKVEKDGECAAPARKLFEYVQGLPATNPVEVSLSGKKLKLATKGFGAEFMVVASDDFPLLPQVDGGHEFKVGGGELSAAVSRVIFAAAREASRPEIHSVYVVGDSKRGLRLAATDSFRLVEEKLEGVETDGEVSFLWPISAATESARLLSDQKEVVVTVHDSHMVWSGRGVELVSRLVSGNYPEYERIIPSKFVAEGVLEKDSLLSALKTLVVFLSRDLKRVKCEVKPSEGKIKLGVAGGESGSGEVELDWESEGEDVTVWFNVVYLIEGLQKMVGDKVRWSLAGASEPAVFSPVVGEGEEVSWLYVAMPIQV